jgi:hypothetical protein
MPELSPDCHFQPYLEYEGRAGPEMGLKGQDHPLPKGKGPSFSRVFSLAYNFPDCWSGLLFITMKETYLQSGFIFEKNDSSSMAGQAGIPV